jgi:hypothetical protein
MKRLLILLTAAALSLTPRLSAQAPAAPVVTAAVLDFQSSDERKNLGAQVATLLAAKLSGAENLVLVERAELDKILGEMELGLSGTVAPDSAAKIGHLTGAKVLITGRVFATDDKSTYIVAKIIGTETSRVYGEAVNFAAGGKLDEPVGQLADKILTATKDRGDTLVAKVESPDAFIERLRKSIEGKALPTVAVEIAEAHLSRPVADPAAQTELKLILQRVGFEVVDPARADKKPDMTIKGDAFSEMGMRRGNLVSCKARVELQVIPRDTAKPTRVDRQTEVAVDLSENIASKSALQKAGAKLAERLVAMLVRP